MVFEARRLIALLGLVMIVGVEIDAKYLGIYNQIYHRYEVGYFLNEFEHRPIARHFQRWDGKSWVTGSTTNYQYVFDDDGRVIRLERRPADENQGYTVYDYVYDGCAISEVIWKRYETSVSIEPAEEGNLVITRTSSRIVELDYESGDLKSEAIYELDYSNRVERMELLRWNSFVSEMRTSIERNIFYLADELTRIDRIESDRGRNQPLLVKQFSYSGDITEISYSDGRSQELEIENGRLIRSSQTTQQGQFARIVELFEYDHEGRLVSMQTHTYHDEHDRSLAPDFGSTRVLLEYR